MSTNEVAGSNLDVRSMFLEMLRTQYQLNTTFIGPDWIARASAGKDRPDFCLAAAMEIHEFLDSEATYKWWKKPVPDLQNCKTELVDAWHFVMSFDLSTLDRADYDRSVVNQAAYYAGLYAHTVDVLPVVCANSTVHQLTKRYLHHLCEDLSRPDLLFQLMLRTELPITDLYKRYIGKAVLNRFRQAHGDKAGTYRRHWLQQSSDGTVSRVEDNKALFDWLEAQESPSPLAIRGFLDAAYNAALALELLGSGAGLPG